MTIVCNTIQQLHNALNNDRFRNKRRGFVPTMGALHAGHTALIEASVKSNDITISSIYVNPSQFNNADDLKNYPHMPEKDLRMLEDAGCDLVFIPSTEEIYPDGIQTLDIHFGTLETVMEGAFRPGHFRGVATIVSRLYDLVKPDEAFFGEKDFQQLAIIRELARRNYPRIKITGIPTIREADGLAMSSRNLLLTPEQRKAAPLIYKALKQGQEFIPHHTPAAVSELITRYIEQSKLLRVEYCIIADPVSLEPVTDWNNRDEVRCCIAVLTEGPRLIDNIAYRVNPD